MMREDPGYRHLAKRYLDRSQGDAGDIESYVGNVMVVKQQQPTTIINQRTDDEGFTQVNNATEDPARMQDSVKQAIAQIQNNIKTQQEILANQLRTNLGSQINAMMLTMLTKQMQVAEAYSPPRLAEMTNKIGGERRLELRSHDMRYGWSTMGFQQCHDEEPSHKEDIDRQALGSHRQSHVC